MLHPFAFISRLCAPLSLVLAGMLLAGCQSEPRSGVPRNDVVIRVTQGGAPVPRGDVDLNNEATREGGGGSLDATGTATIPKVAHGEYVVTLLPPSDMDALPGQQPAPGAPPAVDIPAKFRSAGTSPWKITVGNGPNEFTLDLND